jgi:hypothetical protein
MLFRTLGVLLMVGAIALVAYAWFGKQPGGRTIEQVMVNGRWQTVRDDDESLPIRRSYSLAALAIGVLGAGLVGASFYASKAPKLPSA